MQFNDTKEPATFKVPEPPNGDVGTSRQSSFDVALGNIGQVSHQCTTCMTTWVKNVKSRFTCTSSSIWFQSPEHFTIHDPNRINSLMLQFNGDVTKGTDTLQQQHIGCSRNEI